MMNNISRDTSPTRISLSNIASADEAPDIAASVQFLLADNIRSSLSFQLSSSDSLIENILSVSDLMSRVKKSTSGPFSPVTVEKLKNSPRTTEDLSKLFLNDGPRIGDSISEGQIVLDDLRVLGAEVEAKILYPLLTETRDSEGKLISSQFQWLTQEQINNTLSGQLTSLDSDFPGANSFLKKTDESSTTYTSFQSYGIVRPDLITMDNAYLKIDNILDSYRSELLVLVANTSRAALQLDSMVDRVVEAGKVLEVKKAKNDEKNRADLIDLLRRIYILKIERFTKDDLIKDPEISNSISGKMESQAFTEILQDASDSVNFKTDPVTSLGKSQNSTIPDK